MLTIVNTCYSALLYTHRLNTLWSKILTNRLKNIGQNIRNIRKTKNIPQVDLAVEVGIDRAYLSEIENGRTNTTINILYAIADALKVEISDLFKTPNNL